MSQRAGPLPAFHYGTYWMHLNHGSPNPWPTFHSMRRWKKRKKNIDHLTDGKAFTTANMRYEAAVVHYNKHFENLYGTLYDKVLAVLNDNLDSKVVFAAREFGNPTAHNALRKTEWGLPAFNIHTSHAIFSFDVFQMHIDGSSNPIVDFYREEECDEVKRITFTLSLETYDDYAGLDYYYYDERVCPISYLQGKVKERRKDKESFYSSSGEIYDVSKCLTKARLRYR